MYELEYIQTFLLNNLNFFLTQNISVLISMPGNGTSTCAKYLYKIAQDSDMLSNFKIDFLEIQAKEDFNKIFLESIKDVNEKHYNIFSIYNYEEDYSDILKSIKPFLQLESSSNNRIVISSPPFPIWESFLYKDYFVSKNLFILPLMTYEQACERIMRTKLEFNGTELTKDVMTRIYDLSKGHGRLLKYLTINFFKNNKLFDSNIEDLIELPDLQMALNLICKGLPKSQWNNILQKNITTDVKYILKNLGYIDSNGDILIPLLAEYLKTYNFSEKVESQKQTNNNLNLSLSYRELMLFEYFKSNLGNIVSRDDVSKILWGENWLDEYSDWALSQVIHSIRDEITDKNLPYKIKTIKGKGFVMI